MGVCSHRLDGGPVLDTELLKPTLAVTHSGQTEPHIQNLGSWSVFEQRALGVCKSPWILQISDTDPGPASRQSALVQTEEKM